MKHRSIFLSIASAFLISSCTAKTPEDEKSAAANKEVEHNEQAIKPEVSATPVPDRKSILTDIYKQTVGELNGSQLSDGRYVSYWNDHQFTLGGKRYFVAFSEATPESEIEYPAPEDMVTISQATYEFVGDKWKLKTVQHNVGKFGGRNRAPSVNFEHLSVASHGHTGNFIIAMPSVTSAMSGIQLYFYELFVYSQNDSTWKYLGHVESGYDNSAGCAHEPDSAIKTQCVKSSGILLFPGIENSRWPEIKVVLQGTELGEDGNAISLPSTNSINYRYHEEKSSYLPFK